MELKCQHCSALLPSDAAFCGACGQAVSAANSLATHFNTPLPPTVSRGSQAQSSHTNGIHGQETARGSTPFNQYRTESVRGSTPFNQYRTTSEEEEEEQRRRRMLGLGIPLAGAALEGQPGNIPLVTGSPPLNNAAMIQGTPGAHAGMGAGSSPITPNAGMNVAASPAAPHASPVTPDAGMGMGSTPVPSRVGDAAFSPSGVGNQLPTMHSMGNSPTILSPSPSAHTPHPLPEAHNPITPYPLPKRPNPSQGHRIHPGFVVVASLSIILMILLGIIVGPRVFAADPTMQLRGSSTVTQGSTLQLQGHNFGAGSTIALMLDDAQPLYIAQQPARHTTQANVLLAMNMATATSPAPKPTNVIKAGSDGSFAITIPVGKDWSPGSHKIRATEQSSNRSATTQFIVETEKKAVTPTPTPTATATPTEEPTATPTEEPTATPTATPIPPTNTPIPTVAPTVEPTVAPTTTPSQLSSVDPSSLTLGPVTEGSTETVSGKVTLTTNGTGLVSWKASDAETWLTLDLKEGQIQAPGSQELTVTASVGDHKAGTYYTTITFRDNSSSPPLQLDISFVVQKPDCVTVSPTTLKFDTRVGESNPYAQTVTLKNCGPSGTWYKLTSEPTWFGLSASPTSGTLDAGGSQTVYISVQSKDLAVGTYTGAITFIIGKADTTLTVTLDVTPQPGPH